MKFAAIAPAECVPVVAKCAHSFHLVLAHELIDNYSLRQVYRQAADRGDFIIVDNGVAEGKDVPFIDVARIAFEINAAEIVMPDVIGNWEASVEATLNPENLALVPPSMRVFAPHGETRQEVELCLQALLIGRNKYCSTIALTKGLERVPGGRAWVLWKLDSLGMLDNHQIHLLGAHLDPARDLKRLKHIYSYIRSIDTVAPFSYAQQGIRMDDAHRLTERPSMDWSKPVTNMELALSNFLTFRKWVSE
jgi:hypothetical protein